MYRRLLFIFAFIVSPCFLMAQGMVSDSATVSDSGSHLRISLLTCSPGQEIWEIFGHTAVRIVDSSDAGPMGDIVYNYGTFNGFDQNYEMKFVRGKLDYYVNIDAFPDFMGSYAQVGRKVEEQVLLLTTEEKEFVSAFLEHNALPANRNYKYDYFFDNCATRIRDIFPHALGGDFVYGAAIPEGSKLSFRDIINVYFFRNHWERVGVNILLGSRIDKVMSNKDIMFLPDYLRDGMAGAMIGGKAAAAPRTVLVPGGPETGAGPNVPLFMSLGILLLTILGHFVKQLRILGKVMNITLLVVTGLLGCLILAMWFATDHVGCSNNCNILWCLPTNLILAFSKPKGRSRYAFLAMLLLIASLMLHILHVQCLTLSELLPLFLALLLVYSGIYRTKTAVA